MNDKTPTNTTRQIQADPAEQLGVLLGGSAAIYAQEARGQREMVESTVLPTDMGPHQGDFEALGFTFGDAVKDDPLFRHATLPQGWEKRPTDHSMWSAIVDERGIERVSIFYKAAFYDRKAHMRIRNVGRNLATGFIYGEEPEVQLSPSLTREELEQVKVGAESYLEDGAEYPHIYKEGDRARKLLETVEALLNV